MAPRNQVVLSKSADWSRWIWRVKIKATNTGIWELVDPDLEVMPVRKAKPQPPERVNLEQADTVRTELAKANYQVYKLELAEFKKEEKALTDLFNFIRQTISPANVIHIQRIDPHPWNVLRTLKQRLAPSETVRELTVEQKYRKLCEGPSSVQNISQWIRNWWLMLDDAKGLNIVELRTNRAVRDFILAIRGIYPVFAYHHHPHGPSSGKIESLEVIKKFRHYHEREQLDEAL